MKRVEAFRIYKSRYASSALTGEGAKKLGGRWNHEGVAVLYCSSSLALAQLETVVHLEGTLPPGGFEFLKLEFPEICIRRRIRVKDLEEYGVDWRSHPPHALLREIGSEWIASGTSLVMQVPSVVSPTESNYLLNPAHPDFRKIKAGMASPVEWDSRLLKRLRID